MPPPPLLHEADTIVLSGGGMRAIAYSGALAALEPGGVLAAPSLHALGGDLVAVMDVVLKLRARDLHLLVQQPEIDTQADPGFFETCRALTAFNGERAMIRRAEAAMVARGVRGAGLKGLKGGVAPIEDEDD